MLAALALVLGTTGITAMAAGPYDTPPVITIKGKAKLKKGKVKVAVVTCGTGTCTVTQAKAKIVAANGIKKKGKFTKSSTQPTGSGQSRALKVKVPKSIQGLPGEKINVKITAIGTTTGLIASAQGKTKVK